MKAIPTLLQFLWPYSRREQQSSDVAFDHSPFKEIPVTSEIGLFIIKYMESL